MSKPIIKADRTVDKALSDLLKVSSFTNEADNQQCIHYCYSILECDGLDLTKILAIHARANYRKELIQVAAVCLQAVNSIDLQKEQEPA